MDKLERIVSENRFTIAVIFPLIGAITFLASAEGLLPEILSFNPWFILFGTVVMRLPLVAGLKPLIGKKAAAGLILVSLYSYFIEYVGLRTGWPYGSFEYLLELGPMFEGFPLALPIFFIPLVLNSYLLVNLAGVSKRWLRFLLSLMLVLAVDAVLDPAMVSLGVWQYAEGFYYGVPLSNYLGWVLSGSIVLLVVEHVFDASKVRERLSEADFMLDDFVSFVFLWGVINLYYFNIIPVIIAALIGLMLHRMDRFSFAWQA